MKRILSLIIAVILLAGISPPQAVADTHEKLTVMVYNRDNMDASYGTADHNPWTAYVYQTIFREYGIEVEYLAVPRNYGDEQLRVMLAAGTAPDIVFTYDYTIWQNACERGGVADLSESIQRYGGNILRYLEPVLPYGEYDGKQMGVQAIRSQMGVTSGFIRKDWLDKLGIPLTKNEAGNYAVTTEELHTILRAFQQANLGGVDPDDTWGLMTYGTTYWPILLILEAFYHQAELTDEIVSTTPFFLYPGAKEGYRYLNRLYNDGLLYPDFALIGDADRSLYVDSIINENVGFWINDAWFGFRPYTVITDLYERNPSARIVAVDITNATGSPAYKYSYNRLGMMVFVPDSSKHIDAAVKYLNWLADPVDNDTLTYGFEGEHYELVDGMPVAIDIEYNNATLLGASDLGILYNGGSDPDTFFASIVRQLPEDQQELRIQANNVAMSNVFTIYPFVEQIGEEAYFSQKLTAIEKELRLRCILCSPDAFDSTWDMMVASYLTAGGQAVIDAKKKAYSQMH